MAPQYIPVALRRQIREDAEARCGYCHTLEAFIGMPLEIDHLFPEALGGATVRENLWLACARCNDFKGDRIKAVDPQAGNEVPLFNPRTQRWQAHFRWSLDGSNIIGLTAIGRATVQALRLNNDFVLVARNFWLTVGRWPPLEDHPRDSEAE